MGWIKFHDSRKYIIFKFLSLLLHIESQICFSNYIKKNIKAHFVLISHLKLFPSYHIVQINFSQNTTLDVTEIPVILCIWQIFCKILIVWRDYLIKKKCDVLYGVHCFIKASSTWAAPKFDWEYQMSTNKLIQKFQEHKLKNSCQSFPQVSNSKIN